MLIPLLQGTHPIYTGFPLPGEAENDKMDLIAQQSLPLYTKLSQNDALQYQCLPVEGDSGRETCGTVKSTKPLKVGNCLTRESGKKN